MEYGVFGFTAATLGIFAIVSAVTLLATYLLYIIKGTLWGLIPHVVSAVTILLVVITPYNSINWNSDVGFGMVIASIVTVIVWGIVPSVILHDQND